MSSAGLKYKTGTGTDKKVKRVNKHTANVDVLTGSRNKLLLLLAWLFFLFSS